MSKRSGFTLMELLLVVAILAIIAAVAAPQFFRTATQSVDEARRALLKANYNGIKAAINMQIWDETNKPALTKLGTAAISYANDLARANVLVTNGYLQEGTLSYENQNGAKYRLMVGYTGITTAAPPTGVASSPFFMDSVPLYKVTVYDAGAAPGVVTFSGHTSIDDALKAGLTWDQIWAALKVL